MVRGMILALAILLAIAGLIFTTAHYCEMFGLSRPGSLPAGFRQPRVEVISIDKKDLHLYEEDGDTSQPRISELINESFKSGPPEPPGIFRRWMWLLQEKWDRQYPHLTPERVHGGIQ
jgi:hypothetical protein